MSYMDFFSLVFCKTVDLGQHMIPLVFRKAQCCFDLGSPMPLLLSLLPVRTHHLGVLIFREIPRERFAGRGGGDALYQRRASSDRWCTGVSRWQEMLSDLAEGVDGWHLLLGAATGALHRDLRLVLREAAPLLSESARSSHLRWDGAG